MAAPLFSAPWAQALCQALNDSDEYRDAAATWEGDLSLVAQTDADPRVVYLDLHHGACRSALAGPDAAAREAAFSIEAPLGVWRDLLAGTLDPIMGMMLGKLTVRGNVATIAAHAAAAKALIACATSVETTYAAGP